MYKIKINTEGCDGCGECADVCPCEVIAIENDVAVVVEIEECVGCESCVDSCDKENITVEEM